MKIFIDVGGHVGQTLEAVIDPIYGFDKIYCFEPVKSCYEQICLVRDSRIIAYNVGLLDKRADIFINFPGSQAASIYNDHEAYQDLSYTKNYDTRELCSFISVSDFFEENININDYVVMKLNCEGSECAIIESLIETNQYSKLNNVLIDFDVLKIPSKKHLKEHILNLLSTNNPIHHFPEDVQYGGGSHFGGIKKWLNLTNERESKIKTYLRSYIWDFKNIINGRHLNFYKFALKKIFSRSNK